MSTLALRNRPTEVSTTPIRTTRTIEPHGEVEVWLWVRGIYTPTAYSATGDVRDEHAWTPRLQDLAGERVTVCVCCAFPLMTSRDHCALCEEYEAGLTVAVAGSLFYANDPGTLRDIAWALWEAAGEHDQPMSPAQFAGAYERMVDKLAEQPKVALELIDQTGAWVETGEVRHAA